MITINIAFLVFIGPVYHNVYKLPIIPEHLFHAFLFSGSSVIICLVGLFFVTLEGPIRVPYWLMLLTVGLSLVFLFVAVASVVIFFYFHSVHGPMFDNLPPEILEKLKSDYP